MKTLYADVYFLINFTVDILSLHFASRFAKSPTTPWRLTVGALVGGLYAVVLLFLPQSYTVFVPVSLLTLLIISWVSTRRIAFARRIRFLLSFIIFETLIGGAVYSAYIMLDDVFPEVISDTAPENKRMLIFAVIIVLVMGCIKLGLKALSGTSAERQAILRITMLDKGATVEALVDSGNLLRDPTDLSPVMLMKEAEVLRLFPELSDLWSSIDKIPEKIKKRMRFIPVSTSGGRRLLVAIRPTSAVLVMKNREEEINLTVAIDKDGGSYGGYGSLLPASALDNVKC